MKNFLIAGLGNPGDKYKNNRHNIGFQIIDTYLTFFSQNKLIDKFDSEYTSINFKENKLHIIKPKTFMNESGIAVNKCINFFKIPLENLIVIYDEMDLSPGNIKIKFGGGSAGHNGIKSIINCLGSEKFTRVRIGIGKPVNKEKISSYVLSNFTNDELNLFNEIKTNIKYIIKDLVLEGLPFAMNKFNSKIQ
ncbi:MAG: aminoacyl-tRNA hydrolase [Thermodesulfobacteriota bacterium]|nr:aminoacyl-tRNA hydrolase [Thermodesulfobacteriota bacterium]